MYSKIFYAPPDLPHVVRGLIRFNINIQEVLARAISGNQINKTDLLKMIY